VRRREKARCTGEQCVQGGDHARKEKETQSYTKGQISHGEEKKQDASTRIVSAGENDKKKKGTRGGWGGGTRGRANANKKKIGQKP